MNTDGTQKDIQSYLTFKLGDEIFAAHVSKVLNILEMMKITKVPKAPSYMKGVINLRGMVLPLIDTRLKFGMSETEFTPSTCILVLDINLNNESVKMGAIVDFVQEVIEISKDKIQPPPTLGNKYKSSFIDGMVKTEDYFIMLLNLEQIFSTDEIVSLKGVTSEVAS